MAARPGVPLVPLGHKGDRLILLVSDLFGGMFVENIPIALIQCVAELQVDLLLAQAGLAFAELDRHAAVVEVPADRPDQVVLFGALENVIILIVIADWLEIVVVLAFSGSEALVEQV